MFQHLDGLRAAGVHHVILNLKYGARDAGEVLEEIGQEILPRLAASEPVLTTAAQARPARKRVRL